MILIKPIKVVDLSNEAKPCELRLPSSLDLSSRLPFARFLNEISDREVALNFYKENPKQFCADCGHYNGHYNKRARLTYRLSLYAQGHQGISREEMAALEKKWRRRG